MKVVAVITIAAVMATGAAQAKGGVGGRGGGRASVSRSTPASRPAAKPAPQRTQSPSNTSGFGFLWWRGGDPDCKTNPNTSGKECKRD